MARDTLNEAAAAPLQPPGRCYRVGGSVRDELLGLPASDQDWVVVGTTPQAMLDAGFRAVGKDFPVFLHPHTGEEYALARTERKSGPGYRGFVVQASPTVTLEDDLARRDLTINAMARDADGRLVDPHGGLADLRAGILRHVSPAFAEDPVRLLRLARFAARWPHFRVAPDTQALLEALVRQGEVDALVPERVWQELARGLMESHPSRMLQVLDSCGAAARILPGLSLDAACLARVDAGAAGDRPLDVRAALLLMHEPALAARLRAPQDVVQLAQMLAREHAALAQPPVDAWQAMSLFERNDAWRRPTRLERLLDAAAEVAASALAGATMGTALGATMGATPGAAGATAEAALRPTARWRQALAAALAVDAAAAVQAARDAGLTGPALGSALQQARRAAVDRALTTLS